MTVHKHLIAKSLTHLMVIRLAAFTAHYPRVCSNVHAYFGSYNMKITALVNVSRSLSLCDGLHVKRLYRKKVFLEALLDKLKDV